MDGCHTTTRAPRDMRFTGFFRGVTVCLACGKNKAESSSHDEEGNPVFKCAGKESCNGIRMDRTKVVSLANYLLFELGCRLSFGLEREEFIWDWVQNDHDSKPSQVLI